MGEIKRTIAFLGLALFTLTSCDEKKIANKSMEDKLPIGYYLKKTDNLLTEGINRIHQEVDITRTDWQIINAINENAEIDRQQIADQLSDFANKETINEAVATLLSRQLIHEDNYLSLTEKGKNLYRTCFQKQKMFRQKTMSNITEADYLQTIVTLKKNNRQLGMNNPRENIIQNYIDGYNKFDTEKMTRDFSEEIVFQNIQNGEVNMTLEGKNAFKQQAEQARAYFVSRQQSITAMKHRENETEIEVDYSAVLAADFPNGMRKGEKLELKGKSIFKFLDDKIVVLTDIS